MRNNVVACGVLILVLALAASGWTANLDGLVFLKVAPEERLTVVKLPEGEMRLLGVGDQVTDELRIVEVGPDQVVLEGPGAFGPETILVRLKNGRQTIDRVQRRPLQQRSY